MTAISIILRPVKTYFQTRKDAQDTELSTKHSVCVWYIELWISFLLITLRVHLGPDKIDAWGWDEYSDTLCPLGIARYALEKM